jgi:hypothetical protein
MHDATKAVAPGTGTRIDFSHAFAWPDQASSRQVIMGDATMTLPTRLTEKLRTEHPVLLAVLKVGSAPACHSVGM